MKSLSVTIFLVLTWAGFAWAHSDLSNFPPDVQIIQYQTTLWMNPVDLKTRNDLAMAYYLTNKLESAEKELKYVLNKDPRDFDALDGLGVVLIRKKQYKESLEYLMNDR